MDVKLTQFCYGFSHNSVSGSRKTQWVHVSEIIFGPPDMHNTYPWECLETNQLWLPLVGYKWDPSQFNKLRPSGFIESIHGSSWFDDAITLLDWKVYNPAVRGVFKQIYYMILFVGSPSYWTRTNPNPTLVLALVSARRGWGFVSCPMTCRTDE